MPHQGQWAWRRSCARPLTLCERALQQVRLEGFELTAVAIIETADLHLRWPAKGDHLGIVIPAPKLHCGGVKLLGDLWVGHQAINDIHEKSSVVCGAGLARAMNCWGNFLG